MANYKEIMDKVRQDRFEQDVAKVDEEYLRRFSESAGSYLDSAKSQYDGLGYGNAYQSYLNRRDSYTDLDYRRRVIQEWSKRNPGSLDQQSTTFLDSFGRDSKGILDSFYNAKDFFSLFESEDAYNGWRRKEDFINQYLVDPEKAMANMDYENDWLSEAQYRLDSKVLDAKDFPGYSKYVSTAKDRKIGKPNFGDKLYEYINNQTFSYNLLLDGEVSGSARDIIESERRAYKADSVTRNSDSVYERNHYEFMTEEEVAIYNYYYAKEGKKRAEEFLDTLSGTLEARSNGAMVENVSRIAKEHPFLASAASVGTSLGSGFEYAGDVLRFGRDKLIGKDARMGTNELGLMTNAVRGTVSDMVDWEIGNWDAFDFVYSTVMSGADSMTSGMLGGAGGLVLGLSAAAQGTNDALQRGMSSDKAFWNGLFSGVFEGLFESVSLGNFNKLKEVAPDSVKTIFKNIGKSMLVNASEETLTEIANIGYDTLMNGEFANYTWEDLKNGAWKNALVQVLESGASGALMGAGFGVTGNTIGYASGSMAAKQIYGADPGALVRKSLEIDPENRFAQRMRSRVSDGKKLSGGQLMRLAMQNESAITAKDMSAIREAASARLSELGETGDINALAAVIAKRAAGDKLTKSEKAAIAGSGYGQRVADELNPDSIRETGNAEEWVKRLNTERIHSDVYTSAENAPVQNSGEVAYNSEATDEESSEAPGEVVTRQVSTGKKVTPQKITAIHNGKATIQTDSGEISGDDIEFGTGDMALLWQSAPQFSGITPSGANSVIHAYRSGDSVTAYLAGAGQEFRNGYNNLPSGGKYADKLAPWQRELIYGLGREAAAENNAKAQAKVTAAKQGGAAKNATTGKVHFDRKGRSFDSVREASLKIMEQLSAVMGVEFYMYESYVNKAGERVYRDASGNEVYAPNGFYDTRDGSIHIDLNAGVDGKGTMLFTAAHELTHFIKQWSPEKFKTLADYLVEQYSEAGESVNDMVDAQIAKARRGGRDLSWEDAFEEMVADSMEAMLTDGNVVQMMADLKQQDKSLWQKIRDWFRDLAADLKAMVDAYKDVKPDSLEGKLVTQVQDVIVILEPLYADALADASENYQAAKAEKNTTPEGGVKYSVRETKDGQFVAVVESDILKDIDTTSWNQEKKRKAQAAASEALKQFSDGIVVNGVTRVVNRTSRREYTRSKDTARLYRADAEVFADKMRAADVADDIVIAATNWSRNGGLDHPRTDDFVDFDHGRTLIMSGSAKYSAEVVVGITSDGTAVFYDVVDMTPTEFEIKNAEPHSTATTNESIGDMIGGSAGSNVAQNNGEVKEKFSDRDSAGNALSQEQLEYFEDSKVRDEQGRLMVMYHGTPNGNHTIFRHGTYFTPDRQYADVYQNPGGSMLSTKKNVDNPKTYEVYLNIKKPFDTRKPKERRIFMQEYYRQWGTGAPLADSGLPDWTDGMDLQEFIEEMGYDYDGLILDEGATGGYGQEVKSRGLSYVVFSSEQVKNVDNKKPTSDPDIRHSERDPELQKVNRVLEKENAELKHDVAYLKELVKLQKQVTGGTKFTKSSVEAAAGQLIKFADAKGSKAELVPLLNTVYEYIAGGRELTWEGVKEAAQPAVEWLQSHVRTRTERSAYAQDVLKDIRNSKVYLDEQQKQEVAYTYGSYNEFRKKAMGSVILSDSATMSLDSQWHEWAGRYPNLFDLNIASTDMPAALMEVFGSLRNMTETDYGYDQELFGQELLSRVYDSYWNVSTLYTVKDKAQKEINRLKFDHAGRMASLKEYHREQTAKLKQEHREDLQRIRQEMREKAEKQRQGILERNEASRQRAAENRKKAAVRAKIRRTVMDLNKLLNKGDKKRNVKEGMQDLVSEALRSADILFTENYSNEDMVRNGVGTDLTEQESKYMQEAREILEQMENLPSGSYEAFADRQETEAQLKSKLGYRMSRLQDVFARERARLNKTKISEVLNSLADAYASLQNSEQSYVSEGYHENVYQYLLMLKGDVGGTTVKDMTLNQLEELHKAYTMVLTTVRNANKMFAQNLKQTREQLGNQAIAEVQKAGGEHGLWAPGEDKISSFSWNNEKPVYAFERIGSETLTKLFENTRAGEDGWAQDMTEARAFYLDQIRKHKYDSWNFDRQYRFTSSSGVKFSLNLEQIMSLYAYSKREQAHDHLLKGGFVFDSNTEVQVNKMGVKLTYLNKTAKAHNVSQDILADIVSQLTAEQKAFVDEMQDYLSTIMGGKGNEVSLQLYGVKLFNEKHYFPLRSAGQYMERAKEADLKKQQGQISIVNSGFTKATTPKSSNPVVLSGFMDVWADHVNEMSMYHSFVLPMEDFRRVYNYSSPNVEEGQSISVNSVIQDAYGEAATGYIDQLYRDLNGGAVSDPRETPAKALMGKFKKAAVFASLSVVVQQPSAIGRAFAIIDTKYFIGAKVDNKRHKQLWAELKQYAPVATIKEMGYFDTGMGKSAQEFIQAKEYKTLKEKAAALFTDGDYRDEVLGKMPALADELTWCAIWEAVKRETKAKNPGMNVKSEDFLQLAGKRFTEVITKTQVYDSVLSRSANMRSKGAFMSMWTAFMAEPTTTINMVEDALRKAKKGNKQYAARAMGAVMTSVVINSLLASLVYAMRDDDEDETFLEKYVQSVATEILDGVNPITYYPFLKDVWSVMQGYDIERSDMSLITSLVEKITKLVKVYSKDTEAMDEEELAEHNKSLATAWWGVTDYLTALLGIPVKNVRRDINGAFNMFRTISQDLTDRDTSWGSLIDKTWDDVKNSIPVVGWLPDATAADKLYDATVNGDEAYRKRLESAYSSQTSLDNAIRKGLRANDSRIWEAAMAWNNNDLEGYKRLAREIIDEGHFSQDNVVMAIQAEAKAMMPKESESAAAPKAKGFFNMDKFAVAIAQGNANMAAVIKADIIDTAVKNGKSLTEAENSFASSVSSACKDLYLDGTMTQKQAVDALAVYGGYDKERAQVIVGKWRAERETGIAYENIDDAFLDGEITAGDVWNMYMTYGGLTQEEAEEQVVRLSFVKKNPALEDISAAAVRDYTDYCEQAGVKPKVFYDAWKYKNSLSGTVKEPMLEYINGLNLTVEQKDALYFAFGWAASKLGQAPWH